MRTVNRDYWPDVIGDDEPADAPTFADPLMFQMGKWGFRSINSTKDADKLLKKGCVCLIRVVSNERGTYLVRHVRELDKHRYSTKDETAKRGIPCDKSSIEILGFANWL